MYLRNVKTLGMAALLCLLPAIALAGQPQGVWRGSIHKGDVDYAVTAHFSTNVAEVHFEGAAACKVKARYVKPDGRALIYNFGLTNNGGPFCNDLLNNNLEVTHADGDESMTIAFRSSSSTAIWSGNWTGELTYQPPHP